MLSARAVPPVLLCATMLLAGCSSGGSTETAQSGPGSTSATAASSAAPTTDTATTTSAAPTTDASASVDLSSGLLPASSFAEGAQATMLSAEDLTGGDPGQPADGAVVSPPECAEVQTYEQATDIVGQQVVLPEGVFFIQSIGSPYEGTSHDPALSDSVFNGCSSTTVTAPDGRQAMQTLTALDLGDLGDDRAGRVLISETTDAAGSPAFSAIYFGDVVDGDRFVSLAAFLSLGSAPPSDADSASLEAGFVDLLTTAVDYQNEALG